MDLILTNQSHNSSVIRKESLITLPGILQYKLNTYANLEELYLAGTVVPQGSFSDLCRIGSLINPALFPIPDQGKITINIGGLYNIYNAL